MLWHLPNALQALVSLFLSHDAVPVNELRFQLRHTHAVSNGSRIVFTDAAKSGFVSETYSVNTRPLIVSKPSSLTAYSSARRRSMMELQNELEPLAWVSETTTGPHTEKRETLRQLAMMTSNSYFEPKDKEWYDLGDEWNATYSYGWEPDADGFRGHVFVSTDESTVVVSIKGTSVPWLGGGPTVAKDKLNDNLLFSCCCARVGPTWSTVCGCYQGGYKCGLNCVQETLVEESLFYPIGTNLYSNISYMYPEADIWLIGHSLGGALASLLGTTFGAPVVAFEAPSERMAARRLHLPSPPSTQHITHVFNTGDPIPMGTCTGVTSTCATGGYALESRCHMGKLIKYDTVKKLRWSVNVQNHPIKVIIDNLFNEDWEDGREVPESVDEDEDCTDCFQWEYI
ncbi:Alpha/Beta hydrolase protein [Armillaria novae-zelandiae]|uniref:triacylglycerol lipase n=1 Tax=Armillaria novae-zelandiae TaxID=153914 RepID=A0AA39TYS9_9AGAR|nr:Alpha/Beta hydrolase protein [Armillaria novae-zelandiae]